MGGAVIFDGLNTFLRNFVKNPTMDADGNPIGGIVGSIRSVKAIVRDTQAHRAFFVWDGEGGSRRRRTIYAEYKAGRKPRLNRELDEEVSDSRANVAWQKERLRRLLDLLGVVQLDVGDIEADDAIGYLVGCLGPSPKVVVSSDRDMWQLVTGTTTVYWPTKDVYITSANFEEFLKVSPENYVLFRALRGNADGADNIRGIRGLGDKTILKVFPFLEEGTVTAADLFEACGDIVRDGPRAPGSSPTRVRWAQAVLDNRDLVTRNLTLMDLSSPSISATAARVIREAAERRPGLQQTAFRLALINLGIQLSDADLVTTFRSMHARAARDAAV